MTQLQSLRADLLALKNPPKAKILAGFFKTGPGQYGEGDIFLGITVPQSRVIAKKYKDLTLGGIKKLLKSKFHEERLVALIILVNQFSGRLKSEPTPARRETRHPAPHRRELGVPLRRDNRDLAKSVSPDYPYIRIIKFPHHNPNSISISINLLYFSTRSDRLIDPVLINSELTATAKSAIKVSAVSPLRCEMEVW